jgi:hypothetical protein
MSLSEDIGPRLWPSDGGRVISSVWRAHVLIVLLFCCRGEAARSLRGSGEGGATEDKIVISLLIKANNLRIKKWIG